MHIFALSLILGVRILNKRRTALLKLRRGVNGTRHAVLAMLALGCVSPLVFGVLLVPCGAVVPPTEVDPGGVIVDDLVDFEIWSAGGALRADLSVAAGGRRDRWKLV